VRPAGCGQRIEPTPGVEGRVLCGPPRCEHRRCQAVAGRPAWRTWRAVRSKAQRSAGACPVGRRPSRCPPRRGPRFQAGPATRQSRRLPGRETTRSGGRSGPLPCTAPGQPYSGGRRRRAHPRERNAPANTASSCVRTAPFPGRDQAVQPDLPPAGAHGPPSGSAASGRTTRMKARIGPTMSRS